VGRDQLPAEHGFVCSGLALESKGHADDALVIAEQGLKERQGFKDELYGWLAKRYEERGDQARALELEITRYKERPDESQFKRVKKLATMLNRWDAVRADLIAFLNKQQFSRHFGQNQPSPPHQPREYFGLPLQRFGPEEQTGASGDALLKSALNILVW